MPPIINLTQSVLPYAQYEDWTYQPWATGLDESTSPQWQTPENFARRLPDAVAATTGALPNSNYTTVDDVGQIAATSNGALTVDGYNLLPNDTVLVKNESATLRNGLYTVVASGSSSSTWLLVRHPQMDSTEEFQGFVLVLFGTSNKGRIFLSPPNQITPGVTPVTFAEWKNRWMSSPLPAGKVLNPATGSLDGAATVAGPYVVGLRCSSDSGATWSDPANIVIGIDERPPPPHSGLDLTIDVATRKVTTVEDPMSVTYGDDFLTRVRFVKDGIPVKMSALSALQVALRERGEETLTTIGGGDADDPQDPPHFGPLSGEPSVYLLYCKIEGEALLNIVRDGNTSARGEPLYVDMQAEIAWAESNDSGVGPAIIRRSSAPFVVRIYDELIS